MSHDTVPESEAVTVIGSFRERNVVPMWAPVSFVGALRDIAKNGWEGDQETDVAIHPWFVRNF